MEAYPGDPYAYMPTGGGRRFHSIEGVLPLILLIVIAFFVLQFLGVLPCIVPIGCGGEAKVLVIGSASPELDKTLGGKEATTAGIKYGIEFPSDYITLAMLKKFNVVILQGDAYFDMNTREAIRDYVDGGGKLIVVGNAGSKHPQYPNVAGWSWPAGQGIPVPAEMVGEWVGWQSVSYGSELRMANIDHPIVVGLKKVGARLNVPSQVFQVLSNGDVILAITTSDGKTVPALVEGRSGLGNVLYFAYDPGQTPEILLVSVKYLAGI